jgi:hypothetical protein
MVQRTDEALWERIKRNITSQETAGTRAGEWSARKAQMSVREYKEKGGGFIGKKPANNSLVKWTEQDWTTKSGKPSSETGERYLPKKAIDSLTDKEYKRTTAAKRADMRRGEQFSLQPEDIANKTKDYR